MSIEFSAFLSPMFLIKGKNLSLNNLENNKSG